MNNRERMIATLEHRQPDKTPYSIGFTVPAHQKMADYYGDKDFASKLESCMTGWSAEPPGAWQEVAPDIWQDHWGVQWNRSVDKDIGVVHNRCVTEDNIDEFEMPDPLAAVPVKAMKRMSANPEREKNFTLLNLGFSLYERAWTLTGLEEFMLLMAVDADAAHRLFDRILEYNLRVIEEACKQDLDAIMFGDDWGEQRGLQMGIDRWREFIGPRVRQMYQKVRASGKYVFIHSCGKVDSLFPELIDSGLQCFNPFQPEVMDVFEMKREYGADLSFYGGVSTQKTLPYGTVEETKDEVKRLIDEVGKDGGLIVAPAHAIPADAKPENIDAMLEVLRGQ